MKVLIDTRQQNSDQNWDIVWSFDNQSQDWEFRKLDVGDYMFEGGNISVDTKISCHELAGNLCSKDHERFRNECIRAKELGIQLFILIREPHSFQTFVQWSGLPRTKVTGATMAKIMKTMHDRYGVRFRFCRTEDAGEEIIKYLKGEKK
jgi:ERCC4-type nuclease